MAANTLHRCPEPSSPTGGARARLVALLLASGLLGAAGCSADQAPPGPSADELTAVPFPSTIELSAADLASLAPDPGDGTLRFSTAPAALAQVRVGNILVGGVSASSPHGLLRAVLAVERDGEALTLSTAQAPIQLAYRTLHVRFARSAAVAAPGARVASGVGPYAYVDVGSFDVTQPFDYVLFDGDGDATTTDDQIAIDGTIGGGFDFGLSLDVDWGDIDALPGVVTRCLESFARVLAGQPPDCSIDALLPEARVTFDVDPKLHANANVHGAAILDFEKDIDLASQELPPIVIGPLVFVPAVDVTASLSGGASAAFSTGVHGSATFHTAVTLSSKQSQPVRLAPPELKSIDFGPNATEVALHAQAKVGAGARLNLLLFAVTGPYARTEAYASIDADILRGPCWSLRAGVEAELGVRVTTPRLLQIGSQTLVDWHSPKLNPLDLELASGACAPPPDAPSLPPGSGPDATRLARPSFTPWSRTFSSPVEGAHAGTPDNATLFSELQSTIDGHFVTAGYAVHTLTKISTDGALVWARDLQLDGARLRPLRVRPARDGSFVALSTAVTAPILLVDLAQTGAVIGARAIDIPLEVCTVEPAALSVDGAGGHYVAGSCVGRARSFLLHLRDLDATLWLLDAGPITAFRARVVEQIDGEAFVSGIISDAGDALFALRLTAQGTTRYAKRYDACAEAADTIPSAALVGAQGEVTMVGSGGAQHNGLVLRLRPDGSVGFASFPGFGFGAGSVFLLDAVAALPTTGYVAGASSVRFAEAGSASTPSAGLVGLDAAGRILWARRYVMGSGADLAASGHVGLRLTDDGGVLATALVSDAADPLGGRLWAFKPRAKDGELAFAQGAAAEPLPITNLPCSLRASERAVRVDPWPVTARSVVVTSRPVQLNQARQTAP